MTLRNNCSHFYSSAALPVAQLTVSKHTREKAIRQVKTITHWNSFFSRSTNCLQRKRKPVLYAIMHSSIEAAANKMKRTTSDVSDDRQTSGA